jgi:hypothetical protein
MQIYPYLKDSVYTILVNVYRINESRELKYGIRKKMMKADLYLWIVISYL